MNRLCALSLLALLVTAAPAVAGVALRDGESLTFRVGWGLFRTAGEVRVSAEEHAAGDGARTRITTETSTRGVIRAFYPFDGRVETVFDAASGRMLEASASTKGKRKQTSATIAFDSDGDSAAYVDHLRPERSTTLEVPPEALPVDFITSLVQARGWNLQPGESRTATVLFDDELYDLVITAERVEVVDTAWGRQEAVLLIPRMPHGAKGLFAKGGEVRVWMSRGDEPLPLRFEVSLNVGTATALLTQYQPPERKPTLLADSTPTTTARRSNLKRL